MFWWLLPIVELIVFGCIGWIIRRQSVRVRGIVLVIAPLVLLISTVAMASLASLGLYKFYACTLNCEGGTTNVLRADFDARVWEYVVALTVPPPLRPACDNLPDLCFIQRVYDLFPLGVLVGTCLAIGGFLLVFFASRNPTPQAPKL